MTTLVPAICTSCRGRLDVDPGREASVCGFCRTPYIVERAINEYTIEQTAIQHADTVIQSAQTVNVRHGAVSSVVGFVERQIQHKRDEDEKKRLEATRQADEAARRRADAIAQVLVFVRKRWMLLLAGVALLVVGIIVLANIAAAGAHTQSLPDSDGNLTVPQSSSVYDGDDVASVVEELEARGFTNVTAEPLGDLITGWLDSPDTVERVEVDGDPAYSLSARYAPGVPIVVYFHSFPVDESEETAEPADEETAYTGPDYEVVIDETVGIGLAQKWVYVDAAAIADGQRDAVKAIIADVALAHGDAELIVQVVTDREVIEANADSTIKAFMDTHGTDHYASAVAPKEATAWIAWYAGGVDYDAGELSTDDDAYAIDWMPAGGVEHESWRPNLR